MVLWCYLDTHNILGLKRPPCLIPYRRANIIPIIVFVLCNQLSFVLFTLPTKRLSFENIREFIVASFIWRQILTRTLEV